MIKKIVVSIGIGTFSWIIVLSTLVLLNTQSGWGYFELFNFIRLLPEAAGESLMRRQLWYFFVCAGNFFSPLFCFDDWVHRTSASFNEFVMRKVGTGICINEFSSSSTHRHTLQGDFHPWLKKGCKNKINGDDLLAAVKWNFLSN